MGEEHWNLNIWKAKGGRKAKLKISALKKILAFSPNLTSYSEMYFYINSYSQRCYTSLKRIFSF